MSRHKELKQIYFYNNHATIVDDSAKEYCYVSGRLEILKVKDMVGYFICHEDLKEKKATKEARIQKRGCNDQAVSQIIKKR